MASGGGTLNGTGAGSNKNSYTYPSALGECGQAVQAAYDAATNSDYNNTGSFTRVYTIGYGSPTSGCTTDKTYSATVTGGGGNWAARGQSLPGNCGHGFRSGVFLLR